MTCTTPSLFAGYDTPTPTEDRCADASILAIDPGRRDNAELVVACRDLGYLPPDGLILDPTYGLGRFWNRWHPAGLVASDIDPERSPIGHSVDFRALPWPAASFGAVVFDPPYKLNGQAGSHASDDGYGVASTATPDDRLALIVAGIAEAVRVCRPGGFVLVKCQDQVCSGRVVWQTDLVTVHAAGLGARKVDRFDLLGHRAQPPGRRQVHARRNHSTLLVFQVGGGAR